LPAEAELSDSDYEILSYDFAVAANIVSKMDRSPDNPGVIAFPPLIWLVNAVISVLVHLCVRVPIMGYGICVVCGIAFIILAPTLALSALVTMKAAGTNVHPSEPSLALVRGGPFRFTRNPMYLALCLLQIALGFFLNDWITLLFVVPVVVIFQYGVILREERYLTAKFGEPYLQYKREVRRWI
jgi:protein-S-isoprenylcysteine O-methyltransferase Ste14